jgi:hypothetical protein
MESVGMPAGRPAAGDAVALTFAAV